MAHSLAATTLRVFQMKFIRNVTAVTDFHRPVGWSWRQPEGRASQFMDRRKHATLSAARIYEQVLGAL